MKITSKALSTILLCSILLVSCGAVTPVPTVTSTSTATTLPTKTYTPIPTQTPSPTTTPSRVDEIFVIPTMHPYLDTTPTPIATPALGYSSMRLRNLSEDDILDLIDEMNQYSYQNFPPSWWAEGDFIVSQIPVALAIQEYLYRFPDNPNAYRLRWQLAFINSLFSGNLAGN